MMQKGQYIGTYQITFPISKGNYAETYRVKDEKGITYFLKLIDFAHLHRTQLDEDGSLLELKITKQLNHSNITSYHDNGEMIINGCRQLYIVYSFIGGETVSQKISREQEYSVYEAKQVVIGLLNGLKHMHCQADPIIHNDISIKNVMLDLSSPNNVAKIIDFGYARYLSSKGALLIRNDINPFYLAPESLNGVFSVQTDIFSAGVLLYHLIFGLPPYFKELSNYSSMTEDVITVIEKERSKPLKFLDADKFEFDEDLANIISRAVAVNPADRFKSADEFLQCLEGVIKVPPISAECKNKIPEERKKQVKKGNGFADIAGMSDLKSQIQSDVIDLIENPEEYKRHGLNLPNGILLYGPPGCGKTFFAEKFAEEVGFSFYQIKPSDIQSKWINASQENVKQLFDEASKQSPSIIFIDEIDALVPNRENSDLHHMHTSVVNEFLAQMNNAGERNLFIIGATNLPTSIDPAILRSGRLEQKYYIAPPDFEARRVMFEIYLKNRPLDFGIEYDELAKLTDGFVSADIRFIVDKTSRLVIREKLGIITMKVLKRVIADSKPTISKDVLQKHEAIRAKFEGLSSEKEERRRIGF